MRSVIEGACAGLAALGVGLIGKERGWSPLQAAAAAAADRVCRRPGAEANR